MDHEQPGLDVDIAVMLATIEDHQQSLSDLIIATLKKAMRCKGKERMQYMAHAVRLARTQAGVNTVTASIETANRILTESPVEVVRLYDPPKRNVWRIKVV